jgi:hypothetical protein
MPWGWDRNAKRYRDTDSGRFMPRADVLNLVQRSVDASGVAADQLASFVAGGNLSPADFAALFREEIKREYIRQYLLGIGGRQQMTAADWGSIGGMLREQYGHLPGFVDAIASGELSEAQIMARARMYINSAREAYERAHARNAEALGMTEESWNLGAAEHCPDCLAFAAMGWQPIGTFPEPGAGATVCLTNCQCTKSYRNPDTGAMY